MVSSGLLKAGDLGYNPICAEVAQLVEQRTEGLEVEKVYWILQLIEFSSDICIKVNAIVHHAVANSLLSGV